MWTVYSQRDGQFADAFVLTGDSKRFLLDLFPYFIEFCEALVYVEELAPFRWSGGL